VVRLQRGAIVVPQRAVSELQGGYQVAVLDGQNKVAFRTVMVGDHTGSDVVISDGLKPGERIIAEGLQKVRPGMKVNPRPFAQATQGR